MKKVLLCPPKNYDIEYEINPWMHVENKVNQKRVAGEFAALKKIYASLGVEMLEIEQGKGLPDMVYAANLGSPHDQTFIVANFKYNQRKGESAHAEKYFKNLGFDIEKLPGDIAFEGQGDLLYTSGKYFFGWGKRSDYEAKKYLEKFLKTEIVDFKLVNPYYYHLDTCFAPLDCDTVAINPESFTREGLEKIPKSFKNIITVGKKDNNLIACNLVCVGKQIIIAKGITNELKDAFSRFGYTTVEVPMDEYRKGGGSVKCLTLEFYS